MVRTSVIKNFDKGLITELEDFSIPENAASSSLNWLTKGDKIELAGGYELVDADNEIAGVGEVTGLHIAELVDGSTQPFYTYGTKLFYADSNVEWQEIGTDQLGSDADGEDISFTNYVSLAGYQTWLSSPNSSLYKIMSANPASITDMYNASKNFKGYIDAQNNRLHLWFREAAKNYLYGSKKDLQNSTVYTTVTAEAIGIAGSTNYTGTLAFKAGGATRTSFGITFTDTVETFNDNKDGTLTGNAGGTGTINYTTGAYDITFNTVTANPVTSTYQWEDSTSGGLADFTFTSPTRVAGEGYFLPQNTGGNLLNVQSYRTDFYCIHERNVYLFSMPIADTNPTNQVYRRRIGMKNWRASVETGEGIYYIDTSNPSEPRFKLLTLDTSNDEVIPVTFSFNVSLKDYNFDDGVGYEWGEYILFACRASGSTKNDRLFAYNRTWKSFDVLDYNVSCMADNLGILWAGDSISNNVQKLFTGFSANDALINNYWEGKLTQLGLDEIKKFKRLTTEGEIQPDQNVEVYLAFDRGGFAKIGDISGSGDYVDSGQAITVGSTTVGSTEIAGGSPSTVTGFHYRREFRVKTDRFDEVKIKFVATSTGYVSVSTIDYYDIKLYGQKNLKRYRQTS